jgi:hypothetical protein
VRFAQIAEEFAVKAFIAQLVMKALDMPILPRAPGREVSEVLCLGSVYFSSVGSDFAMAR